MESRSNILLFVFKADALYTVAFCFRQGITKIFTGL